MQTSIQPILDAALKLSEADRMEIAHRLLDSLPDDFEGIAFDDPCFLEEIQRRANDAEPGVPWKDIYAEG